VLRKFDAKVLDMFLNEEVLSRYGALIAIRNSGKLPVFSSVDLTSILSKVAL